MLTRLKVSGFKNLLDVDVHFGPFTCIAGPNGVGKSNLFDAIIFLSRLASHPLNKAAFALRSDSETPFDISSLFYRYNQYRAPKISFEAEMIIPFEGNDDLNQQATAAITFVRYTLELSYHQDIQHNSLASLKIDKEELAQINIGQARKRLLFKHTKQWRDSVVKGKRNNSFISTIVKEGTTYIQQHQDQNAGRPREFLAEKLPRTVLSTANASESPTALLARKEMESWRLLQLEPSAMRKSDLFTTEPGLLSDGSHLAATLENLKRRQTSFDPLGQVARRVTELVEDIRSILIDRDDVRNLLTLLVKDRSGATHPARSLSDGTLRFIALAVLELDDSAGRLFCLEEPENGIHPERIPAILKLLRDIAIDMSSQVDEDNPMRQVMINTHSPLVVGSLTEHELLFAETREHLIDGLRLKGVGFRCLPNAWWAVYEEFKLRTITRGEIINYLNPTSPVQQEHSANNGTAQPLWEPQRVRLKKNQDARLAMMAISSRVSAVTLAIV